MWLKCNVSSETRVNSSHFYPLVHGQQTFTDVKASDLPSPQHYSSSESVTPKGNTMIHKEPPNLIPNVPIDLDTDQSFSDSYSLSLSEFSYDKYYKQRWCKN